MSEIIKKLESIAAELVIIDMDDLPALANLHEYFIQLDRLVGDESPPVSKAAIGCANLIEKVILKEIEGPNRAFSILTRTVSSLQALLRDNRDESEVKFPVELDAAFSKTELPDETASEESQPDHERLNAGIIDPKDGDADIIAEFINEAREHCANAEAILMDMETGEYDESMIDDLFRSFHTIKGGAGFLDLQPILQVAHESETLLDYGRKGTLKIEGAVADVVYDSIDVLRQLLNSTEEALNSTNPVNCEATIAPILERLKSVLNNPEEIATVKTGNRVGDHLVNSGLVSQDEIEKALAAKNGPNEKLGQTLVRQKIVPAKAVGKALRQQQKLRQDKVVGRAVKEMVKIDTERLDKLVDTIGELVIAESMVSQDENILTVASHQASRNLAHLNKITRELQEMGMTMRLLPVKAVFQKLARAVRDLTRKSGKKVNLELVGEDTEVDRSIIELVGDPLMHMIRNALDHGIESPEERLRKNKPETGTIILKAYHRGGKVHFDIEDDGRGLDRRKILAKAKERNLLDSNQEHSDREIYRMIFQPGFSTAAKVTDVSGRGVGMDVVKRNIDAMRGHLDIESQPGRGTKFCMILPLTLAIIEGMLVGVADEKYIIPTLSIVESFSLSPDMITLVAGRSEMVNLRGEMMPLMRLDKIFGLRRGEETDGSNTVVVVETGRRKLGIVVDSLLGQRQTVIKSLGPAFSGQKWISGGAILSDGHIGLIIDINGILRLSDFLGNRVKSENNDRWNIADIINPGMADHESNISDNEIMRN